MGFLYQLTHLLKQSGGVCNTQDEAMVSFGQKEYMIITAVREVNVESLDHIVLQYCWTGLFIVARQCLVSELVLIY